MKEGVKMINFNDRQNISQEDMNYFADKINECCIKNNFENKFAYTLEDNIIRISYCVAKRDGYAKYTVCYFIKYNNAFYEYSTISNKIWDAELFFLNNCTAFINRVLK
jgi:hypothetical protein